MSPFVSSPRILSLLGVAQRYKVRPSSLLGDVDDYTAFCFDEACAYIMAEMDNGEEPVFHRQYSSFTELYQNLGG